MEFIEITSERGGKCTPENPWPDRQVTVTRTSGKADSADGERFPLAGNAGEKPRLFRRVATRDGAPGTARHDFPAWAEIFSLPTPFAHHGP
jgi:hypothetical protein